MPDVMVIVSKAVFEKAAGKSPKVGDQLRMDRYVTANKALEPVRTGGKLYLVTVRPPDEKLWLVAVLENPKFDGKQWKAAACETAITDISALRSKIKFESGKGISAAAGTLGMSLQTPRVLADADAKLLDAALGVPPAAARPIKGEGVPPPPDKAIPANTGERKRGDALRDAVIDDPTSDLPRQVFADAMQARNDPRGEFIMIELALAGPLSIRKREALKQRRNALVREHYAEWFPYGKLAQYRMHGGFISMVGGGLGKLLKMTELFDNEPVIEVHATDVDAQSATKLSAAPWLARLRHLVIKGKIGDKGFAQLVAAPGAQKLEDLNVLGNGLTAAATASLGTHLPDCTTLVLTNNPIKDAGIAGLCAWQHLADVESLYLSNCGLTSTGVGKLLEQKLPKLVKLTLSHNSLDDGIGKVFAGRVKNLPALAHVELINAKLTTKAIEPLGELKLPKLRRLDVRRNRIKENDVAGMPVFRGGLKM
jgi:uncharacterized protein (TIGR02996 family)